MQRITVIDDHGFSLRLIAHTLATAGYAVETACNGRVGLDLIRRCKPSLVITDLAMPGLHGFEMIREVRKEEPPLRDVPIVVLTDDISREAVMHSRRIGAAGFISKLDFEVAPFLERIASLISGRREWRGETESPDETGPVRAYNASETAPPAPAPPRVAPAPEVQETPESKPPESVAPVVSEATPTEAEHKSAYQIPRASGLQKLLYGLLDRDVTVVPASPVEFDPNDVMAVGVFTDPEGRPIAVLAADLPLAGFGGCALSMIPPSAARDEIDLRRIEGEARANFSEIANIVASLFNRPDVPHVKLGSVFILPGQPVPANLLPSLHSKEGAASFEVGISDYGKGRLSIHLAS